jgi:hypothetical protein
VQSTALVAAWTIWGPAGLGPLRLALIYVLALWIVAGGITLWMYVAFSLAPFSDLLAASLRASASVMWLAPGALLLAARSPVAVAVGLAAVIDSTRLVALSRAPKGETIAARWRAARESEPLLFLYQPEQPAYFSWGTVPIMLGVLALQTGVYALAAEYPLLAAASFATVTAIWTAAAVARGAMVARTAAKAPYSAAGILLTLLLTVTLTAVLLHTEIVQEGPEAGAGATETAEMPGMTRRVLKRLAHVPPKPVTPSKAAAEAPGAVVARLVDSRPAIGAKGKRGFPGVVLRPRPKQSQRPRLVLPGLRPLPFSEPPSAIPFTGEYHLFRTSSGDLPTGAIVETGTPMESLFRTTNGGPMETVAEQTFEPPIDLTHCGKVLVALRSAEVMPVLASMQLVAEGSVEDGGTDLLGMNQAGERMLEFQAPVTRRPLLVHAIRISFQRPGPDGDKSVRIAVEGFTLAPRGR